MVTHSELSRMIHNQYTSRMVVLYDRVLQLQKIVANNSDTVWSINLNTPAQSMKGILMLFELPNPPYIWETEEFYNLKIQKVEMTIEGVPNQFYSQGMRPYQQWVEARKFFAPGCNCHPETGAIAKDLALGDVTLAEFLTNKFALWLDLHTTNDDNAR